jgi:TPP-dependent pyruvate/acetoin dehydrogenase alpha subunit
LHRLIHNSVENDPYKIRRSSFQKFTFAALQLPEDMSAKSAKKKPAGKIPSLISNTKLQQLYTTMLKCRILDSHARALTGGGPTWKGKEAAVVGAAIDLRPEDTIVFSSGAAIAGFLKGLPLRSIFSEASKHPSSKIKRKRKTNAGAGTHVQSAVATGIAYAHNAGGKGSVTVAFLSGSLEECDAEESALLFAGVQKLPIVYVYSGTPAKNIQAYSFGFPVIPVDGSDVVAVYRVAHECTIRAREDGGPSIIACGFDSKNVSSAKSHDPLRNMERYLSAKELFTDERKQSTIRAFEKAIAAARKAPHHGKPDLGSRHIFIV